MTSSLLIGCYKSQMTFNTGMHNAKHAQVKGAN